MVTAAAPFKAQFDMHTRLFNNVTEGIADAEANQQTNAAVNNIKWIAGHMLLARMNTVARLTGAQPDDSLASLFGRGNSLSLAAQYPPIEEIVAKWNEISPALSERFDNISEETLSAQGAFQAPIADKSVRGVFSFIMSHEAYHLGQLSLLRKMAGKEAMSYR